MGGEAGEGVCEVLVLFCCGAEVGTDREELFGAGDAAPAAGDFCWSFTMRMSRSARLLSNGTRKSSLRAPNFASLEAWLREQQSGSQSLTSARC